jgi:hypothetical protein
MLFAGTIMTDFLNWNTGILGYLHIILMFVALIIVIYGAFVWQNEKERQKTTNMPPPPS